MQQLREGRRHLQSSVASGNCSEGEGEGREGEGRQQQQRDIGIWRQDAMAACCPPGRSRG